MLDQAASRMVEPFVKAGYDLDAAAVLLCESDGTPEEVEAEIGANGGRAAGSAGNARAGFRWMRPSACGSGRDARTHFPPRVARRLPTTAPTAPFRASTSAAC